MSIQLTQAEAKILALLWEDAPLTMMQITRLLAESTSWSKHTVISILKRMVQKDTIRMNDVKPAKLYYPLVSRADVAEEKAEAFAGSPLLFMSAMVDGGKLSETEIDELLAMLNRAKEEKQHE